MIDRQTHPAPRADQAQDGESVPCWCGSLSLRPFLPLQVPIKAQAYIEQEYINYIKMIPGRADRITDFGPQKLMMYKFS